MIVTDLYYCSSEDGQVVFEVTIPPDSSIYWRKRAQLKIADTRVSIEYERIL